MSDHRPPRLYLHLDHDVKLYVAYVAVNDALIPILRFYGAPISSKEFARLAIERANKSTSGDEKS